MKISKTLSLFLLASLSACSNPESGPDKTFGGAVLGAAWGAGAGAAVGNQVSNAGSGMLAGAGLGAVAGAMTGAGYDINEGAQLEQERSLDSLKVQNAATSRQLMNMQAKLDRAAIDQQPIAI